MAVKNDATGRALREAERCRWVKWRGVGQPGKTRDRM